MEIGKDIMLGTMHFTVNLAQLDACLSRLSVDSPWGLSKIPAFPRISRASNERQIAARCSARDKMLVFSGLDP